jgi:glyoxylase-like metal-dependent hydrolase (beta-lactamase superfamily II)
MVQEILDNLYKIEIPLLGNPLKSINSYVIKGEERNLIIDTGMNQEECKRTMESGLKELGVDIERTDFFITHLHTDHLGLALRMATDNSTVYFNQSDAARIKSSFILEDLMVNFARLNGFPEDELKTVPFTHPGFKFRSRESSEFQILREGDLIRIGDYRFRCVETPGHTWGHMCLYEPDRKIFVAGDHILSEITPNIQLLSDDWNPLKEYLASLEKVYQLDIELVLPSHKGLIRDYRERIRELEGHHRKRLSEIVSILEEGEKSAFQIASQMSWDIDYDSWDLFPVPQKWFATGEAISHLRYLEEEGIVWRGMKDQRRDYSLNKNP